MGGADDLDGHALVVDGAPDAPGHRLDRVSRQDAEVDHRAGVDRQDVVLDPGVEHGRGGGGLEHRCAGRVARHGVLDQRGEEPQVGGHQPLEER